MSSSSPEMSSKKKTTDDLEPSEVLLPNCNLGQWLHELRSPVSVFSEEEKKQTKDKMLELIEQDEMLPFLNTVAKEFNWIIDDDFIDKLAKANKLEADALEEKLLDDEKNLGDIEVKNCLLAKSNFLLRIGDLDAAVEAFELTQKKTVGCGSQLDILLTLIRVGLLFGKHKMAKTYIDQAKIVCEKGGDWERRNKLKVYTGLYLMNRRKFQEASSLLVECIPIFTSSELLSYENFIFITIILSMMSLSRLELHKSILSSSEVIRVLDEFPNLKQLLHSFYYCQYEFFFDALVKISNNIKRNVFLHKHVKYFIRAIRVKAYSQFLEPFGVVSTLSMANKFRVPLNFIQKDLADYIAYGKLNCKINAVDGFILHNKTTENEQNYLQIFKQGDAVLSKIQTLSKMIDI